MWATFDLPFAAFILMNLVFLLSFVFLSHLITSFISQLDEKNDNFNLQPELYLHMTKMYWIAEKSEGKHYISQLPGYLSINI